MPITLILRDDVLYSFVRFPTNSSILVDGKPVAFQAYTIGGSHYFKLREVGKAMDFGVIWDASTNSIRIDTSAGYSE